MLETNKSRIDILDGFRAIAIISVVFYHFFFRWNDASIPYYGGEWFRYGNKGVPFFFMISGFVICYTLEKTINFKEFWKKRFIRLFPSMLVASILTYVFLIIFDSKNIFEDIFFRNVLISLSFLPPQFFNFISGKENYFSYINSDYWSLWPEIQFYFISSFFYFLDRRNFKRNFICFLLLLLLCHQTLLFFNYNEKNLFRKFFNFFRLLEYLPFFISGSLFYFLYLDRKSIKLNVLLLISLFVFLNKSLDIVLLVSNSIMFSLFFCFLFYPNLLSFLSNKIILNIGTSSYFLYLIHDYIGTVWIKNIVFLFYPVSILAPILIIVILIVFSVYYTKKVESKIIIFLKQKLLKKRNE